MYLIFPQFWVKRTLDLEKDKVVRYQTSNNQNETFLIFKTSMPVSKIFGFYFMGSFVVVVVVDVVFIVLLLLLFLLLLLSLLLVFPQVMMSIGWWWGEGTGAVYRCNTIYIKFIRHYHFEFCSDRCVTPFWFRYRYCTLVLFWGHGAGNPTVYRVGYLRPVTPLWGARNRAEWCLGFLNL